MGWGGGTEIFDEMVKVIKLTSDRGIIIKTLLNVLEDADWDNVYESYYFDDPEVRAIINEVHPGYYDDEDE